MLPRSLLALFLLTQAPVAQAQSTPTSSTPFAKGVLEPPKELIVHPAQVKLSGPRDEQRLVVLGVWADGRTFDLTRLATISSSNAKVATADRGTVRPAGDGTTTLAVEAAGTKASIPVTVEKATADIPVSFSREVEPILTKAGCNSGACHGAALGRGGFRLSLFGFDPAFDHTQIVQSNEGPRVVVSEPEGSILVATPSHVMEHGGAEE